jgi:hypothetical protein
MIGKVLFTAGDVAGAIDAFRTAVALEYLSGYVVESARRDGFLAHYHRECDTSTTQR